MGRIFTIPSAGGTPTEIPTPLVDRTETAAWSPDGSVIMFKEGSQYKAMTSDGSATDVVGTAVFSGNLTWAPAFSPAVGAGTNVSIVSGTSSVTFGSVATSGTVSVTPIPSGSAGTLPAGFAIANQAGNIGQAYEVSTTAGVTPPITVCFTVLGTPTLDAFNRYSVLHLENGVLVDRTLTRDFATKQICAQTTSLSPFVIAEQIDSGLPSVTGLVTDPNGAPMAGVTVNLTGTDERSATTGSDGRFAFVNLTPNGSYNVSPKRDGFLFDAYNLDFPNVAGERTASFVGTAQTFTISGRAADSGDAPIAGLRIILGGSAGGETTTGANGEYSFAGLPADGTYELNALSPSGAIVGTQIVSPLLADQTGVDFIFAVPTSAGVSLGGRVTTSDGRPVRGAVIEVTGGGLASKRTVRTDRNGAYRLDGLPSGQVYVITVKAKRMRFGQPTRVVELLDNATDQDFTAEGP